MSVLRRVGRRYFLRHPAQLLLAVLGIAVGVAAVVAIDLANGSASRAFDLTVDSVAGRATHRIVGGPAGVPEEVYRRLRVEAGFRGLAPVVEGSCRVVRDGRRRETLRVLGVDPLAEAPLRPHLAAFADRVAGIDVGRLMGEPGAVLLTAGTAGALGLAVDEGLRVEAGGFRSELVVAGLLRPRDPLTARGLDFVLVTDVSTAQELLGELGRVDRIDARLEGEAEIRALAERLPDGLRLEPTSKSRGVLEELTRAFRLNLQAMGLLALLVGAFLIHNTMQFAVVQRRTLFGVLRAVGATPAQVFRAVLGEALAIGALGSLLGLGLGILLAQSLLGLVAATIEDFYFTMSVRTVAVDALGLLEAVGLGLGVCVLAALAPALEAVRVPPRDAIHRQGLEQRLRRNLPRAAAAALGLIGLGAAVLALSERSIAAAYLGILAVLLGAAVLTGPATAFLLRAARAPMRGLLGTPGAYAARSAAAGLSRTAVAVAALSLAVAAAIGLGAMIGSFRGTVATWLGTALSADVYVTVPAAMSGRTEVRMDPDMVAALSALDGVAGRATYRRVEVDDDRGHRVELAAVEPGPRTLDGLSLIAGERAAAERAFASGDEVLISEPLAWRLGLEPGDRIRLRTDRGFDALPVVGVFRDYAAERGWVLLARRGYERRFADRGVTSLALWAAPGLGAEVLLERVRARAAESRQELTADSSLGLRNASLEVFDRTFAITAVLRLLCLLVAGLGIWNALSALQLERRREIGVLRALGATPRQVLVTLTAQNGLLGLCAGLCALPIGGALAWMLVAVVNRRSFGWTLLDFELPSRIAAEALVLAVGAALLAGLWPAWRLARADLPAALRDE
jgi:putative ABC transport system permease protein